MIFPPHIKRVQFKLGIRTRIRRVYGTESGSVILFWIRSGSVILFSIRSGFAYKLILARIDPNLHQIIGPEETLKDLPYVAGPAAERRESLHGNF